MRYFIPIALALLLVGSCAKNPFSARDSEEPSTQAGTFIPPTLPKFVLENLKLSYSELVISNFIQTLDSNFIFHFDYLEGIEIDSTWGFSEEIDRTERLFNDFRSEKSAFSLSVQFIQQEEQQDVILDTAAILIRDYVVTVTDSLDNKVGCYKGISRFEMVESSFSYWTLLVWEDWHLTTGAESWADLKNKYR